MTEYVAVRISGEERVRYSQTIKMPKKDYDDLNAMLDSDSRREQKKAEDIIGDLWINRSDVLDADGFEIDEFDLDNDAEDVC